MTQLLFDRDLLDALNDPDSGTRLSALAGLVREIHRDRSKQPRPGNAVNNHIHTFYSFSPYSPAKAVWMSYMAGLQTAGIMDHDTVSGAYEFIQAGHIVGLATTVGVECRADFSDTALSGKRINHPDQLSAAYIALHGIPHTQIGRVSDFFAPYLSRRNVRNRRMTVRINELLSPFGMTIDFDTDVVPLSMSHEGGSITERHLLFAVAQEMIRHFGKGVQLLDFLRRELNLKLEPRTAGYLEDPGNVHYAYDLLGALKGHLVPAFYIDAGDEMPDVHEVVRFAESIGAISAYAYLGDVGVSVTGDKKSQKFEDDYLDLLFHTLRDLGFRAVTYMPSRNTQAQLQRVKEYCERYGFFQISGEDINSPRQSFVCEAMLRPEFSHLVRSTWALIGHERAATADLTAGMFSEKSVQTCPDLDERIQYFAEIGKTNPVTEPVQK